ncbi:MAG: hypothetical protein PHF00_05635 [Elusimicrobia bacterium]|nr:hypothetical protein [Elusimicrobiota bacterium]
MSGETLEASLDLCRRALLAQNRSLAEIRRRAENIRACAAAMDGALDRMGDQLRELESRAPARSPIAAPLLAGPRIRLRGLALQILPYLIILCAGLGYGIGSQARPAAPARLAPAPLSTAPSPADDVESAALGLVYEYRLPGLERDVLDILGAREARLGPSPWDIECLDEQRCVVAFNDGRTKDGEPLYEFDVDLAAETVTPSERTEAALSAGLLAQR